MSMGDGGGVVAPFGRSSMTPVPAMMAMTVTVTTIDFFIVARSSGYDSTHRDNTTIEHRGQREYLLL
jgi:hypothetical protein